MSGRTGWRKDGQAEGRKDGRTEGRKDGRTEGRKDGRTEGRKDMTEWTDGRRQSACASTCIMRMCRK